MLQNHPIYAYLPARDIARARRFYEQVLGFEPGGELEDGVTYRFGQGTAAFLYPTENAGTSKASQAFWQVDDIEQEVATLKQRGVVFERYDIPGSRCDGDIVTEGCVRAAWFKDTEGNIMALIQEV